jgi:predicted SprT family Zn-dependent metalloprotease
MTYLEKVKQRIETTQLKLHAMGYAKFEIPKVEVTKLGKGTSGQAFYYPPTIKISIDYISEFEDQILNRTVPHEVVHHYVKKYHPRAKQAHGPEFRRIMEALGCDSSTKHSMHLKNPPKGKVCRRFEYQTISTKRILRVTTVMHNKIQRNPSAYTSHGEKLVYTGKVVKL